VIPRISVLGALVFLTATAVLPHELGAIGTFVTFHRDGTFIVELVVDREHLPLFFGEDRPENVAGTGPTGLHPHPHKQPFRIEGLTPALDRKIGGILYAVVRGARPAFDGRPVATRIELARTAGESDASMAAAPQLGLILTGTIPPGARAFTWSNTVHLGTYMLTVESEDQEYAERQWLESGKESAPFALAESVVPPTRAQIVRTYLALGFTHILVPASIAIAAVGFYWSVQRVLMR
jgi:hypothetical protein